MVEPMGWPTSTPKPAGAKTSIEAVGSCPVSSKRMIVEAAAENSLVVAETDSVGPAASAEAAAASAARAEMEANLSTGRGKLDGAPVGAPSKGSCLFG